MITTKILNDIYIKFMGKETITSKELISYGLNYNDINKLISMGVIKRKKIGEYSSPSFENAYNYGMHLIETNNYSDAFDIFLKCYELNKKHLETSEYLFYLSLIQRKQSSIKHQILENIIRLNKSNVTNVYLYLLTYITQTAKREQIQIIKRMKYQDLSLINTPEHIEPSIAYNLDIILKYIGDIESNENLSPLQKRIINELITQSKAKRLRLHNQILQLINQEDYKKVVECLTHREHQIHLDYNYKHVLILSQKLIQILETKNVPERIDPDKLNYDILSLSEHNFFKEALEINTKFINQNNLDPESNLQHILLTKINEVIKSLRQEKIKKEILDEIPHNKDIDSFLTEFIKRKQNGRIQLIKEYLKETNKEEYETLIIQLLNIDINQMLNTLYEISIDEYEYNITPYLQGFYHSLIISDLSKTSSYLNIIKQYSQDLGSIFQSLSSDINKEIIRIKKEEEIIKTYLLHKSKEMIENDYSAFIIELPTSHAFRKRIYNIIKQNMKYEIRAFSIGTEPKRLVLRRLEKNYQKEPNPQSNYQLIYNKKRYKECIDIIKTKLKNTNFLGYSQEIYAYLGLSHYHLKNINEAVKYLTIANELNKEPTLKYNDAYNFDELLSSIKKEYNIPSNAHKTEIDCEFEKVVQHANSTSKKQNNNNQKTIIINKSKNLEDIAYDIIEYNLSLDIAKEKFKLTEEQLLLIKLIYARDYYTEEIYIQGDKLLKEVERSQSKTPKVMELLLEVRRDKKFYKYRDKKRTRSLLPIKK